MAALGDLRVEESLRVKIGNVCSFISHDSAYLNVHTYIMFY